MIDGMSNVAPSQTPLTSLLTSLMTQAIELHNRGEIRAAIELYRRVFDAQPGHFDALHLMGVATYQLGDLTLAEKVIGAALAIRPESAEAHNNLGSIHVDRQQYGEAMQCYLQALQHRPDYAEAYANLGNVLLSMERVEEAGACHEPGSAS